MLSVFHAVTSATRSSELPIRRVAGSRELFKGPHEKRSGNEFKFDAQKRIVTQINRMGHDFAEHLEHARVPAANCVNFWEQQTHVFATLVDEHLSSAWAALQLRSAETFQFAAPDTRLPSWIRDEIQSRLQPHRQPTRFPGQELVVRPLRRALAWRRMARLVKNDAVADLSGTWRLEERIRMDEFLQQTGFSPLQRAVVLKAGQVQVIRCSTSEIRVLTRDMRGTSELALPLNRPGVVRADGDGDEAVCRSAFIEGRDIVITETAAQSGETLSVCRRSLQPDGRMCVDVRKRTKCSDGFVSMRIIFTQSRADPDAP